MLSLRTFVRSVPRNASRFSSLSSRSVRRPAQIQTAWRQAAIPRAAAAFSTSRPRYDVTQELAAKLNSEIMIERDNQDDSYRGNIKEYLDNSDFQLEDLPGQEEVVLRRTLGDEKIKVTFSIADFNNVDPEADESEDPALFDEDDESMEGQSGGGNTKGAVNQGRTSGGNFKVAPEDDIAPADREALADDEDNQQPSFPARVNVTVEREGKGAMAIEAVAQDGEMTIDNVYFFPSADLADAKTAEKDWARRGLYTGPPFGQLDEDLQVLLERYLDERGVNTSMALFIPDYIDMKEQKEYLRWLNNVKSFVE
ncbi:Mitochondrial acidic protein mam33 [Elasticomyces elasticus]|nr:Mitochondrial acidic protein mam33 [Elasticomyces elasticus]KAK4985471.1 Mitochondrial acidic protein mam33 [Elasticomyces elasticus]